MKEDEKTLSQNIRWRTSKMVQQVSVLADKTDNLSSVSVTYMVQLPTLCFDLHAHAVGLT